MTDRANQPGRVVDDQRSTPASKGDFEHELERLINRHSVENESNTPDFILAQYLSGCLAAFTAATQQRETWYGRDPRPSLPIEPEGADLGDGLGP